MKLKKYLVVFSIALLFFSITSCGTKKNVKDQGKTEAPSVGDAVKTSAMTQPAQLPVRYQSTGFVVPDADINSDLGEEADEYQIKVGATIRSTGGPQPLWDVMKRLTNLKGMTVSWASDVDSSIPVDVDIAANDNFFDAITNLLRQADYFHEVKGKTVVVRNKDTKVFQIGLPAMKGAYSTTVGGNFLSKKDAASGTEGTVKITSSDNPFDVWNNVEQNLNIILKTNGSGKGSSSSAGPQSDSEKIADNGKMSGADASVNTGKNGTEAGNDENKGAAAARIRHSSRQASDNVASFVIDKSIGLITVTAKPILLKNVENYINNLKKELYRQVVLEAKIIEVYLQDNSKIGLDWSSVLKDFSVTGTTTFGDNGQVYPHSPASDPTDYASTFVSKVTIPSLSFTVLLNALNEQGDSHILANPKLTVLNGQPALISVGKDKAYIKTVTKTTSTGSSTSDTTYTAEVGNVVQGIAMGVMATIIDDKNVILHLTPITTDLVGDDILYKNFGNEGLQVGLPEVRVREMSTMVQVEDGEMLIIGGLIDSVEEKTGNFAPGLGSIPVIKYLFGVEEKKLQKRELVILLTPKII